MICTGDDLGSQDATLMSPETYRRLIRPHQAEVLAAIHEHSRAKVFLHSCGSIYDVIRAEVRRRIRDLVPGAGCIPSAGRCIQPDVPPDGVVARCDAVRECGRYPIR